MCAMTARRRRLRFLFRSFSKASMDIPSTPAAPWFAFTCFQDSQTSCLGIWYGFAAGAVLEIQLVIDLDIKSFFDSIPWDLIEKAIAHHTELGWVRLYVKRWLRAPAEQEDGTLVERTCGTPQGSVVAPQLANLVLHYVFDL
ncbi:reverse transcriptase domain-containing protein [Mesorhizobium sp.]|uniref:reverse transcriptase domain-containing protein n=1 Tax=Mesorhizobium sp. TaxID=1871066 RepID=UPI00339031C5